MKSCITRAFIVTLIVSSIGSTFSFGQMSLVPFVNNAIAVTDIQNCGDNRVFIVEQAGKIKIADLQGNLNAAPYLSITARVLDGGERGLLGLAFSPNYAVDGRFYVNYTNNSGTSVISRFKVSLTNPDVADSLNEEILFTVVQPFSNHNGGGMFFGKDGYLYISFGDGGSANDPGNRSQNLMENLGKLLRINVDVPSGFSIPGSNPFYGSATANKRIWAYGLRNAWRVSSDRMTGDVWTADVGQNLWEEINFQPYSSAGGENYGWRCYEGNATFNLAGCQAQSFYDFPVYVQAHNTGACSVTGGYVYRGAQYSNWFGKYFFTDYCDGVIRSLTQNPNGTFTPAVHGSFQTLQYVTFGEDKYGELYIGKTSSGVLKLVDASCLPVAFIGANDTINHCGTDYTFTTPAGNGFLYQWFLNGSAIGGATSNTYNTSVNGNYHVQVVNTSFCSNNSDTLTLNIINAPVVTISGAPSIMCINGASVNLIGSPSGGSYSGAGVVSNIFTPTNAGIGTHIVTYTFDNGNGCILNASSSIVVDACVSIEELNSQYSFTIHPNPANDKTVVSWKSDNIKNIEIVDLTGKIILKNIVKENEFSQTLYTGSLSKGVYIVKLNGSDFTSFRKLIVQ